MNIEQCKNKLKSLEKKYFNKQKDTSGYFQEVCDTLYDYAEETGDYECLEDFEEIVSSEDMEGLMNYPTPNSLYYWKSDTEVIEVDYQMLKDFSYKVINKLEKDKESSLDIC